MTEFDRLQQAIDRDERWLAGFERPPWPGATAARITARIRAEVARPPRWAPPWRWARWHGAAAAAAMLLLAAGLVGREAGRYRVASERVRALEGFVRTLEALDPQDAAIALLANEIDHVGDDGKALDALLEDLSEQIEGLGLDPA